MRCSLGSGSLIALLRNLVLHASWSVGLCRGAAVAGLMWLSLYWLNCTSYKLRLFCNIVIILSSYQAHHCWGHCMSYPHAEAMLRMLPLAREVARDRLSKISCVVSLSIHRLHDGFFLCISDCSCSETIYAGCIDSLGWTTGLSYFLFWTVLIFK